MTLAVKVRHSAHNGEGPDRAPARPPDADGVDIWLRLAGGSDAEFRAHDERNRLKTVDKFPQVVYPYVLARQSFCPAMRCESQKVSKAGFRETVG